MHVDDCCCRRPWDAATVNVELGAPALREQRAWVGELLLLQLRHPRQLNGSWSALIPLAECGLTHSRPMSFRSLLSGRFTPHGTDAIIQR